MANFIIFGGTFDPPHNGHLRIALQSSLLLNASVIFVPARSPRWKAPLTDAKQRLKMLKLALMNSEAPSGSIICDYELKSTADINYTIDTVRFLKKKHKNDNLYLLIGTDQVNRFSEWKSAEELSELCKIIFVRRPGDKIDNRIVKTYKMTPLDSVFGGEVSSTKIRELKSIDMPLNVLKYIESNRLYFVHKMTEYLDDARLEHSISVANLAYLVARKNELKNPEKCYIAGLLHDIGKTIKYKGDLATTFMKKHYPAYMDLPRFSYHQFIGEYIAKNDFDIDDKEILEAIKFHCTGNENMNDIAKIVYASDKIEPTRGFDSSWLISSCLKDFNKGFYDTLVDNKKYLLSHNKDITNRLTDACFNMYLKEGKNAKKR